MKNASGKFHSVFSLFSFFRLGFKLIIRKSVSILTFSHPFPTNYLEKFFPLAADFDVGQTFLPNFTFSFLFVSASR